MPRGLSISMFYAGHGLLDTEGIMGYEVCLGEGSRTTEECYFINVVEKRRRAMTHLPEESPAASEKIGRTGKMRASVEDAPGGRSIVADSVS
jgi:hypothetical protein